MALQDFTISFTTTHVAEFNNYEQGNISPLSTIFADIVAFRAVSMLGTLFADIVAFNAVSMLGTLNASGIVPFPLLADIIHYSEEGELRANDVVLADGVVLRGSGPVATWGMETVKLNVIDTQLDRLLNVDESNSVIINNGAAGSVDWTLPTNAPAGVAYTFVRTASAGPIAVSTEGNLGVIHDSGGLTSSEITLDSVGAKLSVVSLGANDRWATFNAQDTTSTVVSAGELIIRTADMHLDASDVSSLVITSSPDVDQWNDQTLNGNDVGQGTPADKPHTGGSIGGLNALEFDGISQYLINSVAGGTFSGSAGEIIAVVELASLGGAAWFAAADESTNSTYFIQQIGPTDELRMVQQNAADTHDSIEGTTTSPLAITTPYILSISSDGAAYLLSVDDVVQAKSVSNGSDLGDWFADTSSRDNFTVGGRVVFNGPDLFWPGLIGEVIVFDGAPLSSADRTAVVDHLKAKWGI